MPFFMHPTLETSLKALPSCLDDGERFPPITAGQYLQQRLEEL